MEEDLTQELRTRLKNKIRTDKDSTYHVLESKEMERIATEILQKSNFHVFREPFTSSEGRKQPDGIAVGDKKLIVLEYAPTGDLAHERKMEELLKTKEMLEIISGKEVEFWFITTRMSKPKASNLKSKGIRVIMPTESGTWTDDAVVSQ